jgi:hypothetical protein
MNKKDLFNQYSWVIKVLDSCENQAQIETSERLFELYIKKWKKDLNEKNIILLANNFDKEKIRKISVVKKRGKSFLSKISQLFLF